MYFYYDSKYQTMSTLPQLHIDLWDTRSCTKDFVLFESIITDRGSKYSVSGGKIQNKEDIKKFLTQLKKNKKYAQATHNTYAVILDQDNSIWETKSDDGETGAGAVILRIMQKSQITNTIIVVTRWYGWVKLMGDRFKHVGDATRYFIKEGAFEYSPGL